MYRIYILYIHKYIGHMHALHTYALQNKLCHMAIEFYIKNPGYNCEVQIDLHGTSMLDSLL